MTKEKTGNEVAITTSPASLIELAIEKGADIEKLEKLMALQERWNAQQAKKAFLIAMTEFQSKCPVMRKTKNVSFNTTNYNYAPLSEIVKTIKNLMKKHGLSYRWETEKKDQGITITCVISHVDGHYEKNSMTADKDASGGKNVIQQHGSTMTYLQRYTLIGALGIATADKDPDGRKPVKPKEEPLKITKDKSAELLTRAKLIIDEYTIQKDLQANYKSYVQEQVQAGMHQVHIDELKKYINAKNVSLKKKGNNTKIDLP